MWGHMMEAIETSKIIQVVHQNPNGLNPLECDLDLQYSLAKCCQYGVGALSLAETKLNSFHGSFCQTWQHSSIQSSQSSDSFSSNHQPGVTLTAIVDTWSSGIVNKGDDPYGLGRWSFVTMRGKADKFLTTISAYRVCQKAPSAAGVKTAYMQQYCSLLNKLNAKGCMVSTEPNRQFILDLSHGSNTFRMRVI